MRSTLHQFIYRSQGLQRTARLLAACCGMSAIVLLSGCSGEGHADTENFMADNFAARGKLYHFRCDKDTKEYSVVDLEGNTIASGKYVNEGCIYALSVVKTKLGASASGAAASPPLAEAATSPAATGSSSLVYVLDVGTQNAVRILDPAAITFKSVYLPSGYPITMGLTPDEKSVWVLHYPSGTIAAPEPPKVTIIDTATQTRTGSFPLPAAISPNSIAFSPDGATAYITTDAASGAGSTGVAAQSAVLVVDTVSHAVLKIVATPLGAGPAVLTPDGLLLYTIGNAAGSNALTVVDTTTNTVAASVNLAVALKIFVNPTGTRIYILTYNSVLVFDTATNRQVASIPLTGSVFKDQTWLDFSPSDRFLWVYSGGAGILYKVDALTNRIISTVTVKPPLGGFMFILPE